MTIYKTKIRSLTLDIIGALTLVVLGVVLLAMYFDVLTH